MGKKQRIHFSDEPPAPLFRTACGRFEITATSRLELVTCKDCLRRLVHKPAPTLQVVIREAVEDLPPLFDATTGLPFLTPETYRRRDCHCGTCSVCKHILGIKREAFVAPWLDRPRLYLQRSWRWPSLGAALEWYADSIEDGYSEGSMSDALERLGAMGTLIQHSGRGDSQARRQADDRVVLERAFTRAAEGEPERALYALFATHVGKRSRDRAGRLTRQTTAPEAVASELGQSVSAVKKLIRRLRQRIRGDLRDWGVIR
jgi:hypothetical protein